MKTEKNILVAFLLNLFFSVFELVGGFFTGSVAIISDSVHDLGDAASIGISYFLEKKSKKQPDEEFNYGYMRFSVLGSVITTFILLFGSGAVIYNAVCRLIDPTDINYGGMIIFAIVGLAVNFIAAYFTSGEGSLNQKAVNLHMLEDVLGWAVVLVGSVVMYFTDLEFIDPIMSIGISLFILVSAVRNLKEVLDLFLERTPKNLSVGELKEHITEIDGVLDVHHIHIRSIDGRNNYVTMHIVTDSDAATIKRAVRSELAEHGITHATLELEASGEDCVEVNCVVEEITRTGHHHHHH